MVHSSFTFWATSSLPVSGDMLSAGVSSKRARLVEKPTEMIVTELSGCCANILRYITGASDNSS